MVVAWFLLLVVGCGGTTASEPAILGDVECVRESEGPRPDVWEARTTTRAALHFIDVSEAMLDDQGQPEDELFLEDGLHMTAAGYELWTAIVKPRLAADLGF